MPGSGRAMRLSRGRTHSDTRPVESRATKARFAPSGDKASRLLGLPAKSGFETQSTAIDTCVNRSAAKEQRNRDHGYRRAGHDACNRPRHPRGSWPRGLESREPPASRCSHRPHVGGCDVERVSREFAEKSPGECRSVSTACPRPAPRAPSDLWHSVPVPVAVRVFPLLDRISPVFDDLPALLDCECRRVLAHAFEGDGCRVAGGGVPVTL